MMVYETALGEAEDKRKYIVPQYKAFVLFIRQCNVTSHTPFGDAICWFSVQNNMGEKF